MAVTVTLEADELGLVLDSLRYTKQRFEDYTGYPSYEFKREQVAQVQRVIDKLRGAGQG